MANASIDTFDLWTTAQNLKTSNRGLSASNQSLLGIKKLRELILELAVSGKLVPQDPNEEPASILLEKIKKERKHLIKEGKIKKQEVLPEVGADEKPIELPKSWEWAKLGWGLKLITDGSHFSPISVEEGYPYITVSDIDWNGNIDLRNCRRIKKEAYVDLVKGGCRPEQNDVLFSKDGTVGKTFVVDKDYEFVILSSLAILRPFEDVIYPYFLKCLLMSPTVLNQALGKKTGSAIKRIVLAQIKLIVIPIPPLSEQHRIVSKVDELMALCDQLEQQQTNTNKAHQTLVDTLLGTLTNAVNPAAFEEAWQRIASNFDTLLTTEHSIDQLKQTILQLAVMGKLLPQNPDDEPASELLKKIAKEKEKLEKEGKMKKQASLVYITDDENPFELPKGWKFVRLEALSCLITKGSSPKWQGVSYTENPDDVLFVTSENVGSYELILDDKKFVEMKFNEIEPRSILSKGDYLMNIVGGSIGRTAIYNIDSLANINQAVCLIRILPGWLERNFLLHFFNSSICVTYMFDKQVDNARANLSMGNISKFVIPVPPPAEQHRIVTKIEELFALCDALKERLRIAQALQNQLAIAVVEQGVK